MNHSPQSSIEQFFNSCKDPRSTRNQRHKMTDIFTVSICAIICGAEYWTEVEEFGKEKEEWLRSFLELPHGIPSHDTFNDFFKFLDPEEFESCFINWMQHVVSLLDSEVVALDGKTLRGSHDRANGSSPIHMVSAFATQSNLTLGQVKVDEKSNEITAMPKLIKALDIKGTVVTADAMGCQKKIAEEIINAEADYVLAVKNNHPELYDNIQLYFEDYQNLEITFDQFETLDGDHGRIEMRRCIVTEDIDWLYQKRLWKGVKTIAMVESKVEENGVERTEKRYFLSSLPAKASLILSKIRSHWRIENSLHWLLDVSFSEDSCRVREDHGAENFSVLRRIALNLLKKEETAKVGIKSRRKKAGWSNAYLVRVLNGLQV